MSDGRTHAELVAAGLRDPDDLHGLIADSYVCVDCGMDTWPGHRLGGAPITTLGAVVRGCGVSVVRRPLWPTTTRQ
jgi:hypothetical protein